MSDTIQFREKLNEVLVRCKEKGNVIDKKEVEDYFSNEKLTAEQMNLVFDFLLSQKVLVKGYRKKDDSDGQNKEEELVLTEEELQCLRQYEEDIAMLSENDPMSRLLPKILEGAKELHCAEIFFGDLVQEGCMGMLLGMSQEIEEEELLLEMARENMQAMIESQTEVKIQDRKMENEVNELNDHIKQLTEDMGRKVTIEEVAESLNMEEEKIEDIIRLTGEDLEKTEEEV